jgi:hypothetical protein
MVLRLMSDFAQTTQPAIASRLFARDPLNGTRNCSIYLDLNSNGRRDPGEPSTTSGTDGRYRFSGLAPGPYFVAQQVPDGWKMSRPPNDTNSERFVTAADGGPDATANFGSFCRQAGD